MSLGRRAYDLLRGYVNTEWDRIHEVDEDPAVAELSQSLSDPNKSYRRPTEEKPVAPEVRPPEADPDLARKILGVEAEASFADIRRCYERISRRADPANFPEGSSEALQAAQIQKRVQWAYSVLTETMDVTEKRFRSLEIE